MGKKYEDIKIGSRWVINKTGLTLAPDGSNHMLCVTSYDCAEKVLYYSIYEDGFLFKENCRATFEKWTKYAEPADIIYSLEMSLSNMRKTL